VNYGPVARRAFLALLPVAGTALLLHAYWIHGQFAYDFHNYYWPAGHRVLHGLSPYVYGDWFPPGPEVGLAYPAPSMLAFAALATLPRGVGDVIFTALSLAAPLLALRVLDVKDWRPYGAIMLWPPIISGWQNANLSLLLVLGVAAIWRCRASVARAGFLLALLISLKLFLWPLGLFFIATRRYSTLAWAALVTLVLNSVAWLAIGLDELPRFRSTLQSFSGLTEDAGFSVIGFVERAGGDRLAAYGVMSSLALAAGLSCVALGHRGQEKDAFILGIVVSLLATPVVWIHYLALLIVPLALRHPKLHPLWFLPLVMWFTVTWVDPNGRQVGVTLAVSAVLIAGTLIPSGRRDLLPRRRRPAPA
jgi:alpha-1,2-mannosyltransferase